MSIDDEFRRIVRQELRPILERLGMLQEAPETLSVASAAGLAECDPKTILARIKSGELRGFRPPGARAYRIRKDDFNVWLSGSRPSAAPDPDTFAEQVLRRGLSGQTKRGRQR
ncbi:MAG TPA: hypothetical protein VGH20_01495 [Myxococcales bacterium]|jgi:excisionase family DNA binding protein